MRGHDEGGEENNEGWVVEHDVVRTYACLFFDLTDI